MSYLLTYLNNTIDLSKFQFIIIHFFVKKSFEINQNFILYYCNKLVGISITGLTPLLLLR